MPRRNPRDRGNRGSIEGLVTTDFPFWEDEVGAEYEDTPIFNEMIREFGWPGTTLEEDDPQSKQCE